MSTTGAPTDHAADCPFCRIVRGEAPAAIVCEDAHTLAFLDLRQFHPGHVLVIPRLHLADVRALTEPVASALMATVVRVTRAVGEAFPGEGISLWHSIGPAAHQEVPHLHVHVHPRSAGDGMLRVYPSRMTNCEPAVLEAHAAAIRACLAA